MYWYLAVLKKYDTFDGRAHRREFWMFTLIQSLIQISLMIFSSFASAVAVKENPKSFTAFALIIWGIDIIYNLATLVPALAVTIRRFHDTNRSGWYWLINFIPIIGWVVVIYFLAQDGDDGENKYGPDPVWEEGILG